MAQAIDEYGTWEVTNGVGCINKCLIEPSQKYINENPPVVYPPTVEERLEAAEAVLMDMIEMMMV